jgi:hypothetical protein
MTIVVGMDQYFLTTKEDNIYIYPYCKCILLTGERCLVNLRASIEGEMIERGHLTIPTPPLLIKKIDFNK